MFRVLTAIIRSWYSCNYSFWHWLHWIKYTSQATIFLFCHIPANSLFDGTHFEVVTGSLNEQQTSLQRQCSTPSATTCPVCVLVSCSFPLMTCKRPDCTAVPLLQLEPNLKLSISPSPFPNTVITQSRRWLLFIHPPLLAIFHPPTPSITQSLFLLHPSTLPSVIVSAISVC